MPELPEMETYCNLLNERIFKRQLSAVHIGREKSINVSPEQFRQVVERNTVLKVERRAKMLLFRLASGHTLLLHLMLGGSMFFGTEEEAPKRTAQIVLSFGGRSLFFHGLRLGYLHLYSEAELDAKLSKLGPDPFDAMLTPDRFIEKLGRHRSVLKIVLTDQSVLSGIGNCYSDEICFNARIQPAFSIPKLETEDFNRIYTAMRSTLAEAVRYGGYMESPFFIGDRITGGYNDQCKVYDRESEPCPRCGHPITRTELRGRKVFYCERCQRR